MPVLPSGAIALDIGANIGDTALQLHLLSPGLRIISLEPVPITFWYMFWNLHANGVPVFSHLDEFISSHGGGVLALNSGATADGRNLSMAVNLRRTKSSAVVSHGSHLSRLNSQAAIAHDGIWRQVTVATHSLTTLLKSLGLANVPLSLLKVLMPMPNPHNLLPVLSKPAHP